MFSTIDITQKKIWGDLQKMLDQKLGKVYFMTIFII